MLLILVSGPSAAGKSSLAETIARELRLPLIAKDTIKEALFDTLGVLDLLKRMADRAEQLPGVPAESATPPSSTGLP